MSNDSGRVKVEFRLLRDEEGWPPADWEMLWAIPRGGGQFELDNIPFFAKGVASGDLIAVVTQGERLIFDRLLSEGGHSTIRIIMYELSLKDSIREMLRGLGCETEGSHLPSLFAVDVPPSADYQLVVSLLDEKARADILEYEESALRH